MSEPVLKALGLTKSFHQKKAVDNVSLTINPKEVYALIGPNGAGKTTIVKMITGLLFPDDGSAQIAGHDISKNPEAAKAAYGYIPDEPFMYEHLTGREFLHLTANLHQVPPKKANAKIKKLAKKFELTNILDATFADYSRGNKQKTIIIAALLHQPKLLIFDEPIVGLDAQSQQVVKDIIDEFKKKGGGVLICTHTLDFAQSVGKRFGILANGKLIDEGILTALRKKYGKRADLEKLYLKAIEKAT